ncbi:hypothetical protein VTK56DRAFT_6536 [Thermocarpiscus australiensis]
MTGNDTYLDAALMELRDALGRRSPDNLREDDSLAMVKNLLLGKDPFDLEEAAEAARACEELWFSGPQGVVRRKFNPHHLLQLANGLRDCALDDELVEQRLYRHFVVGFCQDIEKREKILQDASPMRPENTASMIREVYRCAIEIQGNHQPEPRRLPCIPDDSKEAFCALVEAVRTTHETVIETIKDITMRRRMQIFGTETAPRLPQRDLFSLMGDLTLTTNVGELRRIAEQITFATHIWAESLYYVQVIGVHEDLIRELDAIIEDLRGGSFGDDA